MSENSKKDAFTQSVEWLGTDRGKASLEERENSLILVLSVLANKYEPDLVDAGLMQNVAKAFLGARSDLEATVSLQLLAVAISQLDEEHNYYDHCHEIVHGFMPKLLKKIQDPTNSPKMRAQMVTGYAVLQYINNSGGGGFNVDPLCDELFSIAEGTTSQEAPLTAASIMGVGLIMTLAKDADNIIEDLEPSLAPFFQINDLDVRTATAKLVGLFYEKYQLRNLDSADTKLVLAEMALESARKLGKKDQHKRKSLLRDVQATIHAYDEADSSGKGRTLTRFNLTRQKSISITSWAELLIVQHLKWLYGPGLHTQLANNPWAESIFKDEEGNVSIVEPEEDEEVWNDKTQNRAVNRRKERQEKLEAQGLMGETI